MYHRFSALPTKDEEREQLNAVEDVADLWPNPLQNDEPRIGQPRAMVRLPATEMSEVDDNVPRASKKRSSEPINFPGIEAESDNLMHDFLQKCVEIAVGQQIKEQVLKNAKEKLDAAVKLNNLLREDYLRLCNAVGRVAALRPWFRSEKFLAKTRIEVDAKRGPVREEEFWVPEKKFPDDESLQDRFGPFDAREEVTLWDQRSWSVRSFKLLAWDDICEKCNAHEHDEWPTWPEFDSEVTIDDEQSFAMDSEKSIVSLKDILRKDLESMSCGPEEVEDEERVTTTQTTKIPTHQWPSTRLAKKDRKQIKKLCERHVDPRRSSVVGDERAALKERIQEWDEPTSCIWNKIRYVQDDHQLPKDDAVRVKLCTRKLRAITEIEVRWEVNKENTAAERNSAQLLALKLQWDVNGSKKLRRQIETSIGSKRQKQMDLWHHIVCAAELRGPPAAQPDIFGPVVYDPEEEEHDDPAAALMLLARKDSKDVVSTGFSQSSNADEPAAELFVPMESLPASPGEYQRPRVLEGGPVREEAGSLDSTDDEQLRTMRQDSGGPSKEDFESAHGEKGRGVNDVDEDESSEHGNNA